MVKIGNMDFSFIQILVLVGLFCIFMYFVSYESQKQRWLLFFIVIVLTGGLVRKLQQRREK